MPASSSVCSPERSAALCAEELLVAEKGLERNPKCYVAWHHRLWVLQRGHSDLQHELKLCSLTLNKDARNCQHSAAGRAQRCCAHCLRIPSHPLTRCRSPVLESSPRCGSDSRSLSPRRAGLHYVSLSSSQRSSRQRRRWLQLMWALPC